MSFWYTNEAPATLGELQDLIDELVAKYGRSSEIDLTDGAIDVKPPDDWEPRRE
jgi:hypothetical protein